MAGTISFARGAPSLDIVDVDGLRAAAEQAFTADPGGMTAYGTAVGYVPQDRALFPTMTVWDHLAFALAIRKWPADAVAERVGELADLLGIGRLLNRKPLG